MAGSQEKYPWMAKQFRETAKSLEDKMDRARPSRVERSSLHDLRLDWIRAFCGKDNVETCIRRNDDVMPSILCVKSIGCMKSMECMKTTEGARLPDEPEMFSFFAASVSIVSQNNGCGRGRDRGQCNGEAGMRSGCGIGRTALH